MKQLIMALVLIITVAVSVTLRLQVAGWMIIVLGIPLLIGLIVHLIVHIKSILNIPNKKPTYIRLMLLSNLFFFLGFVLQVDGDDRRTYLPILFWTSTELPEQLMDIAYWVSNFSFLALIVSWSMLMDKGKNIPKLRRELQET